MSLATRCTSCGTVFRVVQDQLKISEGWVRCGRCEQVFNALEGLFDLERDTPPGVAAELLEEQTEDDAQIGPVVEAPPDVEVEAGAPSEHGEFLSGYQIDGAVDTPEQTDPHLVERINAHLFGSRRSEPGSTPAAHVDVRDRHEFSDARFNTKLFEDDEEDPEFPGLAGAEAEPAVQAPVVAAPEAPEFLIQAQRRARWQRPRMRIALSAASALLVVLFVMQAAHHFRDAVAARWPDTKPLLLSWCEAMGCSIGTPKRIEDIVVDSTALGRIGTSGDAYRLSVTLRNRGQLGLAIPSVELTLTDSSGQLQARRILAPRDFQSTVTTLPAGGDVAMQVPLSVGALRISGYTVEVFYP